MLAYHPRAFIARRGKRFVLIEVLTETARYYHRFVAAT